MADDVHREALRDWLDQRELERDDHQDERDDEFFCARCGRSLLPSEGPLCAICE